MVTSLISKECITYVFQLQVKAPLVGDTADGLVTGDSRIGSTTRLVNWKHVTVRVVA